MEVLVAEGRTEVAYLKSLQEILRATPTDLPRPKLHPVDAGGFGPEYVVETAIELFEQYGRPDNLTRYFALFDTEYPDIGKAESVRRAVRLAKKKKIISILSHPCFEVWLHCHLTTFTPRGFPSADECIRTLDAAWREEGFCTSGYRKGTADVFQHLKLQHIVDAMARAQRLRGAHGAGDIDPSSPVAATDMHTLLKIILPTKHTGSIEESAMKLAMSRNPTSADRSP